MPVVGTAGHVDHGKSTLVQALTGRDPDRWPEEKERGLTIDLGFAWTVLPSGVEVGFVDVPGHERFIKNMLAGVGGMDVAILLVAADEGWMPQSEEHMAVLDLVGVADGVVALSRVDLVDQDTVELVNLEVADKLAGTALEHWPIVAVSPVTGAGMDQLREELDAAVRRTGLPTDAGRPRLWVDRSFTIRGAGVVVTGTLVGGTVAKSDELELWPGPRQARARGLQTHEREATTVGPGNRLAMNLAGVDREQIVRGSMIGLPGGFRPSSRMLADLRTVRALTDPLTDRGAYQFHMGTGAWPVRVRLLDHKELRGRGPALLKLADPLPITMGDRFLLRDTGRRAVVAGGRVLDTDPDPDARRAATSIPTLQPLLDASPDLRADGLLEIRGLVGLAELAAASGGGRPSTALFTDSWALSEKRADELMRSATDATEDYQKQNPLRPGIPRSTLASHLDIEPAMLTLVIERSEGVLLDDGATVRTAGFSVGLGPTDAAAWEEARARLLETALAVPRASELALGDELLHALIRERRLIKVANDLVFLPEQIHEITARVAQMTDGFTVAQFRDELSISRRQAVPLLEWLDAQGWTTRRGDVRYVRRRPEPTPPDVPPR